MGGRALFRVKEEESCGPSFGPLQKGHSPKGAVLRIIGAHRVLWREDVLVSATDSQKWFIFGDGSVKVHRSE